MHQVVAQNPAGNDNLFGDIQGRLSGGQSGIRSGIFRCVQIGPHHLQRTTVQCQRVIGHAEVAFHDELFSPECDFILDFCVLHTRDACGLNDSHVEGVANSHLITGVAASDADGFEAISQGSQVASGQVE